jgi:hypothetical protein
MEERNLRSVVSGRQALARCEVVRLLAESRPTAVFHEEGQ